MSAVADRLHQHLPPIGFAHRGARAHAPENTIEAFQLAVRLGATGLETDAWLTEDGEVVLDHDGEVRSGLRKRPIASMRRDELPSHIPTLGELYDAVGTALPLSIDVKDPGAAEAIVAVASAAGGDAVPNLYLCTPSFEEAVQWRGLHDDIKVVDSTRLRKIKEGPERRAAALADAGVDVLNMHIDDWSGGLTALLHRFGRLAFGWDAQHRRQLDALLATGIDAVYSDHVDRMMDAIAGRPEITEPGL
jgi:glycerophosphoryl diester phosphodiesterase